ncbi:unnamed protein product [Caenorhabditis bovis]|uniref:Macoilin n=1 Tax=Caenorhabditis bovis TaxID=2654633 RepID=A0A8S1F5J2_9PELO|nr:unnamed protein product [Caenorhabditis bovis]
MPIAYIRLGFMWLTIVSVDAFFGFRIELLWPVWLILRAAYESMNKSNYTAATTANQNNAKFSAFFVCITATSDLIFYLFVPVRILVLLATTYVWINVLWQTHGGYVRTFNALISNERSHSYLVVAFSAFVILFEFLMRARCDQILNLNRDQALQAYLPSGVPTFIPISICAFFGAHGVGYPVVLVTFSLKYYFKEWQIRRKQGEVAIKNENLNRLLIEALPADYEGPKDYSVLPCIDEDPYLFETSSTASSQPMAITAPYPNGSTPIQSTSSHKKNGYNKNREGKRSKKNGFTPPIEHAKKKDKRMYELDDYSDGEECGNGGGGGSSYEFATRNERPRGGGVWFVRFAGILTSWLCHLIGGFVHRPQLSPPRPMITERRSYNAIETIAANDEDEEDQQKMNGRIEAKSRSNTLPSNGRHQKKSASSCVKPAKSDKTSNSNGYIRSSSAAIRDSSRDTNTSNELEVQNLSRELDMMRAELSSKRNLEEDMKLQISMLESSESRLTQTISHLRMRIDQMESKCNTLEKHREADKSSLEQSEHKYAQLMIRKSELEQALILERKARNEDTGKKMDLAEHQREKERQLEKEVDRLRLELKSKEETNMSMEAELSSLRNYKEDNDIDAINMELRIQKDKSSHLESSLASENRLKQELFRALGDAKAHNKTLEKRIQELEADLRARPIAASIEPNDDTTNSDQSSPTQHSAVGSPVPSPKTPLSINVNTRLSPYNDKMSPIGPSSQLSNPSTPAPPTYQMAVQLPKSAAENFAYQSRQATYNQFQTHASTGEHLLFDVPPPPPPSATTTTASTCASITSHDLLASRMGKFGAPSNPARSN